MGATIIFPTDTLQRRPVIFYEIEDKDIKHRPDLPYATNEAGYVPLSVGGCVTYQSPVSGNVYQTRFIYNLEPYDRTLKDFNGLVPLGADIPWERLKFLNDEAGYYAQ